MPKAHDHVLKILDSSAKRLSKAERAQMRAYLTKLKDKNRAYKQRHRRHLEILEDYASYGDTRHAVCVSCHQAHFKNRIVEVPCAHGLCEKRHGSTTTPFCVGCVGAIETEPVDGAAMYVCDACKWHDNEEEIDCT